MVDEIFWDCIRTIHAYIKLLLYTFLYKSCKIYNNKMIECPFTDSEVKPEDKTVNADTVAYDVPL